MTKTLTPPLRLLSLLALWLLMSLGLAQAATETITYFHNDVAGTPILATDASGSVVWKENYQPYGSRINNAAGGDNSQWFTGKPYDANTGLSYFGARYYDPVIGRFTGMDPAPVDPGNIHGLNRYSYGNNNPYRYVDPDGRQSEEIGNDAARQYEQHVASVGRDFANGGVWALEGAWEVLKEIAITKGSGAVFVLGTKARSAEEIAREMRAFEAGNTARIDASAAATRAENLAKGIAEGVLGPSGKPKIHVVTHSSMKGAKDAARAEVGAGGSTVKHVNPEVGESHFHGVTQDGVKDRTHHEY